MGRYWAFAFVFLCVKDVEAASNIEGVSARAGAPMVIPVCYLAGRAYSQGIIVQLNGKAFQCMQSKASPGEDPFTGRMEWEERHQEGQMFSPVQIQERPLVEGLEVFRVAPTIIF